MRTRAFVAAAALAAVAACGPDGTDGTETTPATQAARVPSTDPAEVQGAWWTWASSAPSGRNPVEDATGELCALGQPESGDWYLAGSFGEDVDRVCTVPAGRRLVIPGVNLVSDEADCRDFMAEAAAEVTVDGTRAALLTWSGSDVVVTGVADNPLTGAAGEHKGHACGVWALVDPLPPGEHRVEIRGESGNFQLSVSYKLTVVGL